MFDLALQEKSIARLKCPECLKTIEVIDIKNIVNNHLGKIKNYYNVFIEDYLNTQPDARHCPIPNCSYRFINEDAYSRNIQCPLCKNKYCSNCLLNHKEYTPCKRVKEANDELNEAWKDKNTKPCPNCNTKIEKSGGCKNVKCSMCESSFCYNCLKLCRNCICRA